MRGRDLVQTQEYIVNWSHWEKREGHCFLLTSYSLHQNQNPQIAFEIIQITIYLLNVDFDRPIVILIQSFEGTWIREKEQSVGLRRHRCRASPT